MVRQQAENAAPPQPRPEQPHFKLCIITGHIIIFAADSGYIIRREDKYGKITLIQMPFEGFHGIFVCPEGIGIPRIHLGFPLQLLVNRPGVTDGFSGRSNE
ncbi:hypothetical protein D3C75_1076950 [compost metagenome]